MKRICTLLLFLGLVLLGDLYAQGFAFGIKGGPLMGFQRGKGAQASSLLSYHGIAFIESLPEGNAFSIFAQAGYHKRGSAQRRLIRFNNLFNVQLPRRYEFTNVGLAVGIKQKNDWRGKKTYYLMGIRGEYTLDNNLQELQEEALRLSSNLPNFNPILYYPFPGGTKRINYGLIIGGGIEFEFTEFIGGLVELTLNPDLSPQYEAPSIPGIYDNVSGTNVTVPERRFINTTIELTVGFRFLRVIEYID